MDRDEQRRSQRGKTNNRGRKSKKAVKRKADVDEESGKMQMRGRGLVTSYGDQAQGCEH
jgi:hypothetical protein